MRQSISGHVSFIGEIVNRFGALGTAALLALLAGCSGSSEPKAVISGSWQGTTTGYIVDLTLVENGGTVTGSGQLCCVPTYAVNVSGAWVPPTLAFTITSGLHPAASVTGKVANNVFQGTVSGSGFNGDSITVYRTP